MNTKEAIKTQARRLFNLLGVKNVTLREVAKQLNKSYGNVTYHFSNKEALITALFTDMNRELSQLQSLFKPEQNLMVFFLLLPEHSFDISTKYLFFSKDFVELKRSFPDFFKEVEALNNGRKADWLKLLLQLQQEGYLSLTLTVEDLDYIMELSAAARLFYFQSNEWGQLNKSIYVKKVNKLLRPYLTRKGVKTYDGFNSNFI